MENEEVKDLAVQDENQVYGLSGFRRSSNVDVGTFTNVEDPKEVFNLSNNVDFKLNDCVGEKIRVKKVLIRRFVKPLDEPIVNEETGEIVKDTEMKISCVLVDEAGKSYATGSKTFTFKLVNYLVDCGGSRDLENGGVELEITKVSTPTGNKALGFKVL